MATQTPPESGRPDTGAADEVADLPEMHNTVVDQVLAQSGRCGRVHLATGRTCVAPIRHAGSCTFDDPGPASSALTGEPAGP